MVVRRGRERDGKSRFAREPRSLTNIAASTRSPCRDRGDHSQGQISQSLAGSAGGGEGRQKRRRVAGSARRLGAHPRERLEGCRGRSCVAACVANQMHRRRSSSRLPRGQCFAFAFSALTTLGAGTHVRGLGASSYCDPCRCIVRGNLGAATVARQRLEHASFPRLADCSCQRPELEQRHINAPPHLARLLPARVLSTN